MVALSRNTDAGLVVENCRRKRLLITPTTANRAGDSHESAIFMIEAWSPAGVTLTRHYPKR
jgi:hypothetical protein